ncbi:MAG: TIGR02757 family protein [Deltaproteobacteria bacterium]|nr:TIGR02757 family protein [Deltaproteobacteria bacterium]
MASGLENPPRSRLTAARAAKLKSFLEPLFIRYHHAGFLETDPLRYVHRYRLPEDRETVALLSAALAYGNVRTIFGSIERVLEILGPSPAAFLRDFDRNEVRRRLAPFRHRFNSGDDVLLLLHWTGLSLARWGRLGEHFRQFYKTGDSDIGPALSGWVRSMLASDCTPVYADGLLPGPASARFLLSDPADGSACKRMNLFLRWMVRRDELDVGLWDFIQPSQLVLPLDAHLSRIVRYLGLTDRATNGWAAAQEATASLRLLDPDDPLRYDFALCRLGILGDCPAKPDRVTCASCMLLPVCRAGTSRTRLRKGRSGQKREASTTAYAARPSEPI